MRRRISNKQRALAKTMANGNYTTKTQAISAAGYSNNAALAQHVLKSKGVQLALLEESTKVGNIIDSMSARLATEDFTSTPAADVVDMLSKLAKAQKDIMACMPQKANDSKVLDLHVIDLN